MQIPNGVMVSVPLDEDLVAKLEEFEPTVMSLGEAVKIALQEFFRNRDDSPNQSPNS